jgi:hypothetical protein
MSEQKEFFIPPGYGSAESEGPNISVPGYIIVNLKLYPNPTDVLNHTG